MNNLSTLKNFDIWALYGDMVWSCLKYSTVIWTNRLHGRATQGFRSIAEHLAGGAKLLILKDLREYKFSLHSKRSYGMILLGEISPRSLKTKRR